MAKRLTATGPVEGPWALPEGWRWDRIDNVAPVNPRRGPDRLADETEVAFVPMAAVQTETGVIDVSARRPVSSVRQGFTRFGTGDVIFAKITPCMENGKIAVIPAIPADSGFGSTEFHVMSPRDVTSSYLYYWVSQRGFRETAEFNMTGTAGQKRVPADFMRDALIPVPPADEQNAVVARIDELFAEIDDGEAALTRARDDLATWRKALLKAAVTGELTADWRIANPTTETGADLLARILADRRANWEAEPGNKGKRYKEPRPVACDDERELPDGWTWASVDQIGEVITGNTPPASDLAAYNGDVPFFTPGDLDAGFALDATKRTLGPSGLAKSRPVPPRSVLVTCIGATIGKVGFNARAGATNQQINTIIPVVDDLAECIFHYFDGPGRHLVIDGASSTTMPIINKGDFSRLPVPIPPLEEARAISRMIAARYTDANAAREDLNDARLAAATLRQSILAAAFCGELA